MQRVAFTNGLMNQLQHFSKNKIHSTNNVQDSNIDHDQQILYPVKIAKLNERMAQNILKNSSDEMNDQDAYDVNAQILLHMKKLKHWNKK